MSILESDPVTLEKHDPKPVAAEPSRAAVEVLGYRDVPLGGPRAMRVRRLLPQRQQTTIGAWCFIDHYGPDDVDSNSGMYVPPHPHTGIQTVSWLFSGEIEHRDSTGSVALVRPGAVNLMTAGRGISHSEVSMSWTSRLHGVQLWVALPDESRNSSPFFEHANIVANQVDDATVRVFAGELPCLPVASVSVFSPLVGAEITIPAGGEVWLGLEPSFEHGLLIDSGTVSVTVAADERDDTASNTNTAPTALSQWELGYLAPGHAGAHISALEGDARIILLGGEPFAEKLVMWWNFVGRSHDEIVDFRNQWQADVIDRGNRSGRFGRVPGFEGEALPAPELPRVRLKPRGTTIARLR